MNYQRVPRPSQQRYVREVRHGTFRENLTLMFQSIFQVKQKALGHQHPRLERVFSKAAHELLKHLNQSPNAPDSPANELPDLASDSHSLDARPTDLPANWPPSTPTKDSSPKDLSPGDLPLDARDENSGQKTNSSSSVELQGIVTPSPDCPVRSSSLKVSLKAHRASLDGPESGEGG